MQSYRRAMIRRSFRVVPPTGWSANGKRDCHALRPTASGMQTTEPRRCIDALDFPVAGRGARGSGSGGRARRRADRAREVRQVRGRAIGCDALRRARSGPGCHGGQVAANPPGTKTRRYRGGRSGRRVNRRRRRRSIAQSGRSPSVRPAIERSKTTHAPSTSASGSPDGPRRCTSWP